MKRPISVGLAVLVAALSLTASTGAEQAVIPPSSSLPWTDPNHQTPIEAYTSLVASNAAHRPIRVYCHGADEWAALGQSSNILGYVGGVWYNVYTGVIVRNEDIIHLNGERICVPLKAYAEQAQKLTKCSTFESVTKTVYDTVRVKKKVWYWTKIRLKNGKTKRVKRSKFIWITKRVPRTITEEVPGPRVPCYPTQPPPTGYHDANQAVMTVSHEFIHILDFTIGNILLSSEAYESRAECYGMQLMPAWARSFGADPDDAQSMARYQWDIVYPRQPYPYNNPGCQPNSSSDLTPNDGVWPWRRKPSLEGPIAEAPPVTYEIAR